MLKHPRITQTDDYEEFVGSETIERMKGKTFALSVCHDLTGGGYAF
jgi:hypothetical protein